MEDRERVRHEAIAIGREYGREKERDKKRNGGRERERVIMMVKEIAYHVCISITIYVFACHGEIGRNGGKRKSETGSNSDREGV